MSHEKWRINNLNCQAVTSDSSVSDIGICTQVFRTAPQRNIGPLLISIEHKATVLKEYIVDEANLENSPRRWYGRTRERIYE